MFNKNAFSRVGLYSFLLVAVGTGLFLFSNNSAEAATRMRRLPTVNLTASSQTITLGEPVGLAWSSSNAASATVSASPTQAGWSGSIPTFGSRAVTPMAVGTMQYKITVSNSRGTANATVSITVLAPIATSGTIPVASTTSKIQWGAFAGNNSNSLSTFETLVGAQVNVQAIFLSWQDGVPTSYKTSVAGVGKTLLVYWEPTVNDDTINSGSQDAIITNFANSLKSYGGKTILVLNEEVNCDNWSAWGGTSGSNNNTKAIAAFRHIHDIVKGIAPNVLFAYDVNNDSCYSTSPSNSLTAYYPGDAYVDIVGVSGFNFGNPWESWQDAFITNNAIATLQPLGKPVWILATASLDGAQKAQWISDMAAGAKKYNIAGWIWFHQNDTQVPGSGSSINWMVNSNPTALTAFQTVVAGM